MYRGSSSTTRPILISVLLVTGLLLAACKPPADKGPASSSALSINARLDGAPLIGTVPVVVEVTEDGAPVVGATVKVTGDMTHAGMQPVTAVATELGDGTYRADDFAFTMAGDWFITVDVTTAGGTRGRSELLTTVSPR